MAVRVFAEGFLAANRPVYVSIRDQVFLREGMGKDRPFAPMKEVQDPVLYASKLGAKLADLSAEQVGFRTSQVVSYLRQSAQSNHTLGERSPILFLESLQPLEDRDLAVVVLAENDLGLRHKGLPPLLPRISILL